MTDTTKATDHIATCPACHDDDNECGAIYDHGPDGVRLQCDCGCCGPWGVDMGEARYEWNLLANTVYRRVPTARVLTAMVNLLLALHDLGYDPKDVPAIVEARDIINEMKASR